MADLTRRTNSVDTALYDGVPYPIQSFGITASVATTHNIGTAVAGFKHVLLKVVWSSPGTTQALGVTSEPTTATVLMPRLTINGSGGHMSVDLVQASLDGERLQVSMPGAPGIPGFGIYVEYIVVKI